MRSLLGLGGYFNNPIDTPEEIIEYAYENHIRTFDTSPYYGESEKYFGNVLSKYDRKTFTICTKTKATTTEELMDSIFNSLDNLKVEYLDFLFGHSFIDSIETLNKHLHILEKMKDLKRTILNRIGVSGHSVEAAMYVLDNNLVDCIMIPHSIMYTKFDKVIEKANKKKITVITMKNFGSGILLGGDNWKDNEFKRKVSFHDIINFAIQSGADLIIPAARSISQLKMIITYYNHSELISDKHIKEVQESIINILGIDFCRSCNECRPCKKYGWAMSQSGILKALIYHNNFNKNMKEEYAKYKLNVNDCGECDDCSQYCPFYIDIKEEMHAAHKILGVI